MKKIITLAAAGLFLMGIMGCSNQTASQATNTVEEVKEEAVTTEEAVDTEEKKTLKETIPIEEAPISREMRRENFSDEAIVVVSFGTSYNESREITIGAIEKAIEAANPDKKVYRAFTSQIIIDKLKERDGIEIDNVTECLERLSADGVKNITVQPTHLMNGLEYNDVIDELKNYSDLFDSIKVGAPLLTSDDDFDSVAKAISGDTSSYDDGETAIIFMGHGTEADSNSVYAKMQETFKKASLENYYVATVEAEPTLDDVREILKEKGYKKVVLEPLMVVCGDHANNDMAGDEDDSWKSILVSDGYEVECILEGLGQKEAIQNIYVNHVGVADDLQ